MKQLWEDIELIYNYYNYRKQLVIEVLIDNLMINSHDNYYVLHSIKPSEPHIHIKIEKNYNLTSMWNDDTDGISYELSVSHSNKEISDDVDKKVELVNNIIKPHLRQAKLNKLGV